MIAICRNWSQACARTTVAANLEALFRKKNGEIVWRELSASLIELGGTQCVLSFAQDITDAKAAEERLAAAQEACGLSEERYRTVFQTSLDGIAISRLSDGRYIDATGIPQNDGLSNARKSSGNVDGTQHVGGCGARREIKEMLRRDSSFRDMEIPLTEERTAKSSGCCSRHR